MKYQDLQHEISAIRTQVEADRVGRLIKATRPSDRPSLGESYIMVCDGLGLTAFRD